MAASRNHPIKYFNLHNLSYYKYLIQQGYALSIQRSVARPPTDRTAALLRLGLDKAKALQPRPLGSGCEDDPNPSQKAGNVARLPSLPSAVSFP